MVRELTQTTKPQLRRRSPLLVAAYCTLGLAIILMVFGSGLFLTVGTAAMAVLLAVGEIVVQRRRRSPSA
jgi:hypothetical protein